jgi:hypothetical protein
MASTLAESQEMHNGVTMAQMLIAESDRGQRQQSRKRAHGRGGAAGT